ncbi:hypothetical protein [Streptomyces europaeiscabiei]|uniref:hypothetical protein n=1 Tax=Streptomyces europaeiscabiei TaxID=146819 RepID=UPI0029B4E583|nr:hypothetical protein [Streptomyces europaeiscabiei]MDX3835631.1 hypothetical protein [Streptomyces europaeiscabiei]
MTTDPTPESARALLDRHGLPEDVIDGVLCLHAQELAAVQRKEAAVWGVDTAAGRRIVEAADLIDPTRTAAAVPVAAPPTTEQEAAVASCPGYEASPNPCRCPCEGCKHHCGAHQPAVSSRPGTEQEA